MDKKSNNVAIVKKNLYGEKALVIFLLIILFTVCAINSDLWQGVVTAKYFYFACVIAISVAGVAIWYIRRQLQLFVIRFTDVSVAIFFIYVVIHQFMNSGIFGVQWYLFLLMFPLYFLVRTFNMQHFSGVLLTHCLILLSLIESVWGILQCYSLIPSYHPLFPVNGSLFNPGTYSGFIAIGIPLIFSRILSNHVGKSERIFCVTILSLAFWAMLLAGSRSAWLSTIVGCAILLWYR